MVGTMPLGRGGAKFIIAAIDYFMKWAKAEAMTTTNSQNIMKVLWKTVICRFGIPWNITSYTGKHFDFVHYRDKCAQIGIKVKYSSL